MPLHRSQGISEDCEDLNRAITFKLHPAVFVAAQLHAHLKTIHVEIFSKRMKSGL